MVVDEYLPKSALTFVYSIIKKIKKSKIGLIAVLIFIGQGLYVSLPGLLGLLIDKIIVQSSWQLIWILLFPTTWLFSIFFSSIGKFYISSITQDVRKISKELIFKHIIRLPNSVYIGRDAGEVEHLMHELSFNARYLFNESFPFFSNDCNNICFNFNRILYLCRAHFFIFNLDYCLYPHLVSEFKKIGDFCSGIISEFCGC